MWVLEDPKVPAKKKKTFVGGLATTHRARVQNNQDLSPKNGVGILTFVRKTCVIRVFDCFVSV